MKEIPSISWQSLIISFGFLCQLTNFTILRDGLSVWNTIFGQQMQYMIDLEIIFMIETVVSMIIGGILYRFSRIKIGVIVLFSIGVIIGNAIIFSVNGYYLTPLDENIPAKIKLGYTVAFACIGATLPCMLDYGFAHIPDNDNFKISIAVYATFIFIFWMVAQIFSWHALIAYQQEFFDFKLLPTPLILSIFVLVLTVFAVIAGALDLYQYFLRDPPPEPVVNDTNTNEDEDDHLVRNYYINICGGLLTVWLFYYIKGQLLPYWLTIVNTMVNRNVNGVIISSDTVYEQYLYWMLILCFIFKIILFRNAGMRSVTAIITGIVLTIYGFILSRDLLILIRQRFDGRFTYPDYDNQKFIFINMMAALLKIQFTYFGTGGHTHLTSSAGYFEIDRLQEHFFIKRFDVSYYQILYFGAISVTLNRNPKVGTNPPCHGSYNKWNCPQILAAVTYNYDISVWDYQPCMQIHLIRLDAYCPNENVYQTSSLYALACIRLSPITADKLKFHFISLQTGRTYPLEQHVLTPFDECYYLPPGIYGIEFEQPAQVLINMDEFDFGPGGSYFIFVALHDSILEGKGGSKYSKIYYKQNVALHKVWQKPITISVTFLCGQFLMFAMAEMLIFTSCLEFIYSRRDIKSHPIVLAIFFALIQFGFIWHLCFPQIGSSMYNLSSLNKFILLLLLGFLIISIIKLSQLCSSWPKGLRNYIENLFKIMILRFKEIIGYLHELLIRCFARNYENALQYGMCPAESDDEDRERVARKRIDDANARERAAMDKDRKAKERDREANEKDRLAKEKLALEAKEKEYAAKQRENEARTRELEANEKDRQAKEKAAREANEKDRQAKEKLALEAKEKERKAQEREREAKDKEREDNERDRQAKEKAAREAKQRETEATAREREANEKDRQAKEKAEREAKEQEREAKDKENKAREQAAREASKNAARVARERTEREAKEWAQREAEAKEKQKSKQPPPPPPPPPSPPPQPTPFKPLPTDFAPVDPNARGLYRKKKRQSILLARRGTRLHNPHYGEDFMDSIQKKEKKE